MKPLNPAAQDSIQRSYEHGYRAGLAGPPYTNPWNTPPGRTPMGPTFRACRRAWEKGLSDAGREFATDGEAGRAAGLETAA